MQMNTIALVQPPPIPDCMHYVWYILHQRTQDCTKSFTGSALADSQQRFTTSAGNSRLMLASSSSPSESHHCRDRSCRSWSSAGRCKEQREGGREGRGRKGRARAER